MRIYCNTGDPRLDEMGEIIIRNAAATVEKPAFRGRIVLSFRGEDAGEGDGLILLYRGEESPVCFLPNVRVLRCPYAISDLEGAVRSLLSAGDSVIADPLEWGGGESVGQGDVPVLLFDGRRVIWGTQTVNLTGREAAVFRVLYEKRGTFVSREVLCKQVWGDTAETNLCEVYVCRLRRALTPVFGKGFLIHTRNEGYMIR